MYWSKINTDSDKSKPIPQKSEIEIRVSRSSTNDADAVGRSLAIAAFMTISFLEMPSTF
jgi:hypothetical protein